MILPCREDCNEAIESCFKIREIQIFVDEYLANCNYLPAYNASEKNCYTMVDVCGPPPEVKHGTIK